MKRRKLKRDQNNIQFICLASRNSPFSLFLYQSRRRMFGEKVIGHKSILWACTDP